MQSRFAATPLHTAPTNPPPLSLLLKCRLFSLSSPCAWGFFYIMLDSDREKLSSGQMESSHLDQAEG